MGLRFGRRGQDSPIGYTAKMTIHLVYPHDQHRVQEILEAM